MWGNFTVRSVKPSPRWMARREREGRGQERLQIRREQSTETELEGGKPQPYRRAHKYCVYVCVYTRYICKSLTVHRNGRANRAKNKQLLYQPSLLQPSYTVPARVMVFKRHERARAVLDSSSSSGEGDRNIHSGSLSSPPPAMRCPSCGGTTAFQMDYAIEHLWSF